MENKFFKVDLHIHTPASKCYKGKKDEVEYLSIAKTAKQKNIKIIAFTDHNSIEGYKKFQEIRENLQKQKTILSRIKDSKQSKKETTRIEKILKTFQDILILPALEFEVSNCVHFLVIFDEKTSVKQIERFLRDGGYDEDQFGLEEPAKCSSLDIPHFYDELKKMNCIIICSHFDSNKGVYNVIPAGTLRARCLSSEQLNGVEYKSEITRDKISSVIKSAKEYSRKVPLAFVRFSDAHDISEIGRNITYIKLEKIDFDSLKKAFGNAAESISTEYPEVQKILEKLISSESSFGIENLCGDNKELLKKTVCGLHNSGGGYCILGVNSDKNKIGLDISAKNEKELSTEIKKYFDSIRAYLDEVVAEIDLDANVYPLLNKRIIISLQIKKGDNFATLKNDNCIYTIKNKS
ncbi:MAG: RNA-binding domain-containing protein [Candidatus Omnitrophota bacterium]|jgi:hypothetical protein